MNYISGLGNVTSILLARPERKNIKIEHIPMSVVIGFAGTKQFCYRIGTGRRKISESFVFLTRAELKSFVDFFSLQQGFLKKFWVPCWLNEFKLTRKTLPLDKNIYIKNIEFTKNFSGFERIYLLLKGNDFIVRKVEASSVFDSNEEILTLNEAFPYEVSPEQVVFFGRVLLVRFQSPELTLTFRRAIDTEIYATTNVSFLELPHEYGEL